MRKVISSIIPLIVCILLFAGCTPGGSTDNTAGSENVKQAASSEVSTEEANADKDGMRAAYREILIENLEVMSEENIKRNKGSQMVALFDIDGDAVEELFAFIPDDDDIPVLHIFSYENGETIDIVFDFFDRWGESVCFQANTVVVENKYTIFQSERLTVHL